MFTLAAVEPSIQSCVDSLAKLFTIILALAIGEAFKQFVHGEEAAGQKIRWKRIWALAAFVALVVPFFHGMARYFFETYNKSSLPHPYSLYLIIDTFVFTLEAVLFFILSRSLEPCRWRTFYLTVLCLLVVDIGWGIWGGMTHEPRLWPWVWANIGFGLLLAIFVWSWRKSEETRIIVLCMCLVLARTVADYTLNFHYYFPLQSEQQVITATGAPSMARPIVYIASPYTRGDVAMNTHFQCKMFDQMMNDGKVWPVAPLWSHFQHTLFPRAYQDWLEYDQTLLHLYDACLRLPAELDKPKYYQYESSGADREVATFQKLGKPIFKNLKDLYAWVDSLKAPTRPAIE